MHLHRSKWHKIHKHTQTHIINNNVKKLLKILAFDNQDIIFHIGIVIPFSDNLW